MLERPRPFVFAIVFKWKQPQRSDQGLIAKVEDDMELLLLQEYARTFQREDKVV